MSSRTVSEFDVAALGMIRHNVEVFMGHCATTYGRGGHLSRGRPFLLDVAPQDHKGAAPFFPDAVIWTLDIDSASGATYIVDLCDRGDVARIIGGNRFDLVVCTEVLEHTRQPFEAALSILDVLKPGGLVFVTTPYNFRIHGPLPDCWRFTEHGLRELFRQFDILELKALETAGRFLMPIQYTLVARKLGTDISNTSNTI